MKGQLISLFLAATVLAACGGGGSTSTNPSPTPTTPPPPTPSMQGPWEIATVSATSPGYNTFIEVNLQSSGSSFKSYDGPVEVITKSVSLGNPPIGSLTYNGIYYDINNSCANSAGGTITGTVATNSVTYAYQVESGVMFNGQGTYDGTAVIGTYKSQTTNSACIDAGTFTAYPISQPTGTYIGTILFNNNVDNMTMSLSGSCNLSVTTGDMCSVTASGTISGKDNGTYDLTGRTIGNFIEIGGDGQKLLGLPVSYYCLRLSTVSEEPIILEDVWVGSNYLAGVLTEQ